MNIKQEPNCKQNKQITLLPLCQIRHNAGTTNQNILNIILL